MSRETNKGKKRKFKSLAATSAITFSLLIIIVLLIASSLQMYFNYQAQQKLLIEHQQLIARDAADEVESFIREKFNILESVTHRSNLISIPNKERKPNLERLLGLELAFRQLILLNEQGEELLRISRISKLLSIQLMKYDKSKVLSTVSGMEKYISPIYIDKITSEPMLQIAVPVTDAFEDFKGVLIAETNLKFMWDLVSELNIRHNGLVYVVDDRGNIIAFRDISRVLRRENLNYLKEVRKFLTSDPSSQREESQITRGIQNTIVLTTHKHLTLPEWGVIVELPVMEAYKPVFVTLILSVSVIIVSIIISVVLSFYYSKKIIQPIIELRDAAEKVGKGQRYFKIENKSDNEIGDLASSFNEMVEDLNKTTVSRNALVTEIAERTFIENELRKSQQRLSSFMESATDGFILYDSELNLVEINKAALAIFPPGIKKDNVIGKNIKEIPFIINDNGKIDRYQEVIKTKKPFFTDVQGSHAKLGNIYLSIRAFEVGGGLGIVFADITEQKQAEEQIQRDLKEKTTLLQEIHHRVKNNLQIISSLLNLQSNKIENQSCLFALQVSMRRINSMALIHEKLYRSENLSSINFTDYIKSLTQHLLKSYDNKGKHIELKFSLDKIFLGIDSAIPCGLILNELITNSLKHAFLKDRKGKISISFTRSKDKTYTLRVSDNGVGIPESIDYMHSDSLGLTLIRTLADQIEGEAIFENKNGTVCTLNFMGYEYGKTKYSNS